MILEPGRDLTALLMDDDLFDRAVATAQAEAARRHRLLGQPLAVWREGRVVIETADTTPAADGGATGGRAP